MKRFRGGLVFKAHRRVYHPTLGLRVIKKKRRDSGSKGCGEAFPITQGIVQLYRGERAHPVSPPHEFIHSGTSIWKAA